jgi:hypothetical protein
LIHALERIAGGAGGGPDTVIVPANEMIASVTELALCEVAGTTPRTR